jgi:Uma2 family endonuclease
VGVTTALLTVEQFAQLPEEETLRCELVQGEIVRMGNAGLPHEIVKANANQLLIAYILENTIGKVFSETMFTLTASDACIPDVSLLLNERLVNPKALDGAPELAFEVVSSESAAFMERKINLYLATGSRAVWVAYPLARTIWAHRPNGESRHLREGQYLDEPDLLPGFRVLVDRFFEGIASP